MFKSLPGFRDFYPDHCSVRNHIFRIWRKCAIVAGFNEYDAPILEPLELFTEKSGEEIRNQLFEFKDKGGRAVALRPEMTPSLARLVGAKANSLKRPVKWFSISENFRYERQQKGRLRSFYQFNGDIFGEPGSFADAEIIALAVQSLSSFGFQSSDVRVRLSDRDLWDYYFQSKAFSAEISQKLLSVIDKADRMAGDKLLLMLEETLTGTDTDAKDLLADLEKFKTAKSIDEIIDHLIEGLPEQKEALEARRESWKSLLGALEAMGIADYVDIDMGLVRGLAYYTGFVFEIFQRNGEARALAGGGRYDHLVKKLGGPDMHAVGFAMGDVTLTDFLEEKQLLPKYIAAPEFYVLSMGDLGRTTSLGDIFSFRQAAYHVDYTLKEGVSFKKQLKNAIDSGARFALIYGSDELAEGKVKVRDLNTRQERDYPRSELFGVLRSLLKDGILE